MKKKVVHVAQCAGGVAEYLYMLLTHMDNTKYENILIVSEDDYKEQIDRFESITSNIYFVPMVRGLGLTTTLKSALNLRKIIKKIKPDIVYLHSSIAGAVGRMAMLFDCKTKILYNAHGWYFNAQMSAKKQKFIAIIERILSIKTDKIINISQSEYDSAIKYKIANKKKMCIIENGIDFKKFENSNQFRNEIREKYNIKNEEILIGVVARVSEQKDPLTTIKAFKLVHDKMQNTKLMYIGSGELENEVIEYAKENQIEKSVIITGWTNETQKYIPAIDIAILPSKWEGFGLVIIEYMACKKPIVASKVGGIADIIKDEQNGYLIEIGDYEKLSEMIIKYIKDEQNINKTVENNYEYAVSKYSIENVVKKTVAEFERV